MSTHTDHASPVRATPEPDEWSAVRAWRFARLSAAGFDQELARRIAGSRSFDVHALLDLVDRGCPPRLAARILAPVDVGGEEVR